MKLTRKSTAALRLGGALFCFSSFVLGQSGGAGSAEVNASAPSAEVAAAPSATVAASVPGIAARAYGIGSGSGHLQGREAVTGGQGLLRHAENGSLGLGAVKTDKANAKSVLEGTTRRAAVGSKLSRKETAALRRYKTGQVRAGMLRVTDAERMTAGAGKATALKGSSGLAGSYTTDFPDSTKGTALVSPPDQGTASPLEWFPGLDFGLPDFTKKEFLSPSLHAARRSGSRGRGDLARLFGRQRLSGQPVENKPTVDLPQTSLPSFETSVPSIDSPLPSPLDQP